MTLGDLDDRETAVGQRYLDVADGIGCALVRDAVWHGSRCNWLCWDLQVDANGSFGPALKPAAPELYGGVSGIALFLARLQALTGDAHQRRAARGALRQVLAATEGWHPPASGFFAGPAGVGWSLIHVGRSLDDEGAVARGLSLLEVASRALIPPTLFDLLNGRAGAALALVAAARAFDRDDLLAGAVRFAEEMVATARVGQGALSWPSGLGGGDLLGLSHGTAGAALALHEVAAAASRPDLRDAARACLRYERLHFDPAAGWPDLRPLSGPAAGGPTFPFVWCHGGIGIGLSRLRIRELDPADADVAPEIDVVTAAVTARLARGVSADEDFSLCHGIAGLGEFLLELAVRAGRPEALEAARRVGDVGAAGCHDRRSPWACGVPQCGETPSTMTGTPGIGLDYLRLYDPACAPSLALPTGDSLNAALTRSAAA